MIGMIVLTAVIGLFGLGPATAAPAPAIKLDGDELSGFYKATTNTAALYMKGDKEAARTSAESLRVDAEKHRDDWNYGNAVHVANLVLGLIALDEGDKTEAGKRLLASGRTTGSPQLGSFGPNMLLAKRLLEAKESVVVLEYLGLCKKFWKHDREGRADQWIAQVKDGQMPEFGSNLDYQIR